MTVDTTVAYPVYGLYVTVSVYRGCGAILGSQITQPFQLCVKVFWLRLLLVYFIYVIAYLNLTLLNSIAFIALILPDERVCECACFRARVRACVRQ